MKDLIVSILGTYEPVTYIEDGVEKVATGLAGVDFAYVGGLLILTVSIYCVFRLIGMLLNR